MKSSIKAEEVLNGLLKINNYRAAYYQKASEKIRQLKLKTFFRDIAVELTKKPSRIHEELKFDNDASVSGRSVKSKFSMLRKEVKAILYKAYELE